MTYLYVRVSVGLETLLEKGGEGSRRNVGYEGHSI